MSKPNSELENEGRERVPGSTSEIGTRLSALLEMFESRKSAADKAEKSVDQLLAYVKGKSSPPFEVLARLARAKGVSLDWLATGEGPMLLAEAPAAQATPARPDRQVMAAAIEAIEEFLSERRLQVPAGKKALLVTILYEIYTESGAKETGGISDLLVESLLNSDR